MKRGSFKYLYCTGLMITQVQHEKCAFMYLGSAGSPLHKVGWQAVTDRGPKGVTHQLHHRLYICFQISERVGSSKAH